MQKIFFFFKFHPDADRDSYEKFSREIDAPFLLGLPYVHKFQAYVVTEHKKGNFPYDVIEVMEASSWEEWNTNYDLPEGDRIFKLQQERWLDYGTLDRVLVRPMLPESDTDATF